MQKEDTFLMNAHSYWQQAQGEIPDERTSNLLKFDVKNSTSDDLILCGQ